MVDGVWRDVELWVHLRCYRLFRGPEARHRYWRSARMQMAFALETGWSP